jgi:TRAP-type mannitol/chloroaromatic compound transport system permease large subunit
VEQIAMNLPGGSTVVLLVSALFFFILGMFLEPGAIIFFAVPIVAPILAKMGYDPLWIGIAFNVILQCGYISPPFGFSLFYLKGVTPGDIRITDLYSASIPFLLLQFLGILLIFFFPSIVLWLPQLLLG